MNLSINTEVLLMGQYASKSISNKVKELPNVYNLSIGEPEFGPPDDLMPEIMELLSRQDIILDSLNRYEDKKGALELREAISDWYQYFHKTTISPDNEILITHGGVEAIAQALIACTLPGANIAVTNPSYMLYERSIITLGRSPLKLSRPIGEHEYYDMLNCEDNIEILKKIDAIIINSPENPTGYVMSEKDWGAIIDKSIEFNFWIIHDEVYDVFSFDRKHYSASSFPEIKDRSITVNSFSKKFGVPGIRIGWVVGNKNILKLMYKSHDYLYLGVNILFERIALLLIKNYSHDSEWMTQTMNEVESRLTLAVSKLTNLSGYNWPRKPMGGMFLFPNVSALYPQLPEKYMDGDIGMSVTKYLLEEHSIAVVPGSIYGSQGQDHIRMVVCSSKETFNHSIELLTKIIL